MKHKNNCFCITFFFNKQLNTIKQNSGGLGVNIPQNNLNFNNNPESFFLNVRSVNRTSTLHRINPNVSFSYCWLYII